VQPVGPPKRLSLKEKGRAGAEKKFSAAEKRVVMMRTLLRTGDHFPQKKKRK
jgi:hypothetical protein